MGVGPWVGLITLAYFCISLMVEWWIDLTPISWPGRPVTLVISLTMIVLGVAAYFIVARRIISASRTGKMVTDGAYTHVRHPLYAIGVFLLAPGVSLLCRSWLVLATPLVMYVAVTMLVRYEEQELLARFGDEYADYRRRTGLLFPRLPR